MQREIAIHCADIDSTASGFGRYASTDIIEGNAAAATLGFHASANTCCFNIAAFGFQFHKSHFPGNGHMEFARKMPRSFCSLPVGNDPGGVALHISVYFVLLKLMAGVLLGRRIAVTGMNDIIDALLLRSVHYQRAHVHFYS